ncbi:MAG: flagellar protein FlaG [Pseudomonadota bacterium]
MKIETLGPPTTVSEVTRSAKHQASATASGSMPAAVSAFAESAERDLRQQMAAVASRLQEFLNSSQRDVEFHVDADTHVQVVTVRDAVTGQVIRQFPNEEAIRQVKNLTAQQGALLDEAV